MDSELLDSSLSYMETDVNVGEDGFASTSPFKYTEIFYKQFPYYLSIGMTEEQYWDRDCLLTKYYRKAEELRNEKFNQQAWLQGMYFYDSLARISPILHAYAKKGTKAQPYVEEPYPITKKAQKESKIKKEEINRQKGLRFMETFMIRNNERFKKKEGE